MWGRLRQSEKQRRNIEWLFIQWNRRYESGRDCIIFTGRGGPWYHEWLDRRNYDYEGEDSDGGVSIPQEMLNRIFGR